MLFNDYRVPSDLAGGEYQVKVVSNIKEVPPSFRKFRVGTYSHPELFVTADFDKNAYSTGEKVKAKVKVRKPDGERLPYGSSIAFQAGQANQSMILLNEQGETHVEFIVPDLLQPALAMTVLTYLGYTQENGSAPPHVSTHSVPIVDDSLDIILHYEQS